MAGTLTITPIPASPKQPAAAATFNSRYTEITTGVSGHMQGTSARHLDPEIDSGTLDDHAESVTLTPSQVNLHQRLLQLLTMIGDLADRSSTTHAYASVAALTTDIKSLGSAVGNRTALATPNTVAQRGASAEAAFGYLMAYGAPGVDTPEVRVRPIAGQVQPAIVVENTAGDTVMGGIYPTGFVYAAANIQTKGIIIAGSSNKAITAADGSLLASALTGSMPSAAFGPLTGDVTTAGYAATVARVGTQTAAQVQTATIAANAATADAVANPGQILKSDALGNIKVGTITGALTGNALTATTAAAVPATGITGTITATQTDATIAKTNAVPSNTGVGATGTWNIDISGNALTATTAAAVAANAITASMIRANAIDGTKIVDYSLGRGEMADGAVKQQTVADKTVHINPFIRWNNSGQLINYPGGDWDLKPRLDQLSSGYYQYVLLQLNGNGTQGGIQEKPGLAVSGGFANATIPTADPDCTPLAVVSLQFGQGSIVQTDILDVREFISDYGGAGGGGTGGSPIGHVHGAGQEVRVESKGMDEGFVTAATPANYTVSVSALHYRNTSGIVVYKPPQTLGPYTDKPITYERIDLIYLNPSTGQYGRTVGAENSSVPYPAASGNFVGLGYIHMRPGMNAIRASFDAIDGYVEDARAWLRAGGVANVPVVVADGGTGQQTFSKGLIWQADSAAGTTPLQSLPATSDTLHGLSIKPTVTGMSASQVVDNIRIGNGTVTNGSTIIQRLRGTHAMVPAKDSGNAVDIVALEVDAPSSGGTNYASAVFAGRVAIGTTNMPAAANALDVTGNIHATGNATIDGTTTLTGAVGVGALTAASLNVTPGNASVAGTSTFTGRITANNGLTTAGAGGTIIASQAVTVQAGGIDVTGAAQLRTGLTVTGAISATTTITATGQMVANGTLVAVGTSGVAATYIRNAAGEPNQAILVVQSNNQAANYLIVQPGQITAGVAIAGTGYSGGPISGTTGNFTGNVATNGSVTGAGIVASSGTGFTAVNGAFDAQGSSAAFYLRDIVQGAGAYTVFQRNNGMLYFSDTAGSNFWAVNPATAQITPDAFFPLTQNAGYTTVLGVGNGYVPSGVRRSKATGEIYLSCTVQAGASGVPAGGEIARFTSYVPSGLILWTSRSSQSAGAAVIRTGYVRTDGLIMSDQALGANEVVGFQANWYQS